MDESGYQTPFIEGRRRRSPKKRMIVTIGIIIVLLILGIAGMQFFMNAASTPAAAPTPTPTTIVFPTDTPAPTASPTAALTPTPTPKKSSVDSKTKLDRAKLRVMVENGSGVAGAANSAAQLLKNAGYIVTGTQNADAFTYEDVTISVKSASAAYLPLLREDLASEYTIGATNTTLSTSASSSADAVVIIGK